MELKVCIGIELDIVATRRQVSGTVSSYIPFTIVGGTLGRKRPPQYKLVDFDIV
jgi:hypothetical protein